MNTQLLLYNLVLHLGALPLFFYLKGQPRREKAFWEGRMGHLPFPTTVGSSLNLWFHGASMGEVTGAIPTLHVVKERFPQAGIFLSVGTSQGFRFARDRLPAWVTVIPFPLDFPSVIQKTLDTVNPDLYVGLEGELWPNLFHELKKRNIPAVLLNGRLSRRSTGFFSRFRRLITPLVSHFSAFAMLTEEDRSNLLALGAPPDRTCVLGSSKYEALPYRVDTAKAQAWRQLLHLEDAAPVVVGGSLRRSECIQLLDVFESLRKAAPRAVGIFAPRHMKRIPQMIRWLHERGIPHHLLSEIEQGTATSRHLPVVLVDRMGVLFELYGTGDLIFCGGTLDPIGGHNILEPAAWKKAVFYGPHLQKVKLEHNMLHSFQGSFVAKDAGGLLEAWLYWVKDLPGLEKHGMGAREALNHLGGVTTKHLEIIEAAMKEGSHTGAQKDGKA